MKKILTVMLLISFSGVAAYADDPYNSESEMSEDVSLLAQSSLLYKQGGEERMKDNTKLLCRGIEAKYSITTNKSENMIRWYSKVSSICSDY